MLMGEFVGLTEIIWLLRHNSLLATSLLGHLQLNFLTPKALAKLKEDLQSHIRQTNHN